MSKNYIEHLDKCIQIPKEEYENIKALNAFYTKGIELSEAKIKELKAENERLKKENTWLRSRDCNAKIELCYNDGVNPFARESLQVVDMGVSDNIYIVESKIIETLSSESNKLKHAIECAIDSLEDDKCRECNLDIAARHILEEALKGE